MSLERTSHLASLTSHTTDAHGQGRHTYDDLETLVLSHRLTPSLSQPVSSAFALRGSRGAAPAPARGSASSSLGLAEREAPGRGPRSRHKS